MPCSRQPLGCSSGTQGLNGWFVLFSRTVLVIMFGYTAGGLLRSLACSDLSRQANTPRVVHVSLSSDILVNITIWRTTWQTNDSQVGAPLPFQADGLGRPTRWILQQASTGGRVESHTPAVLQGAVRSSSYQQSGRGRPHIGSVAKLDVRMGHQCFEGHECRRH